MPTLYISHIKLIDIEFSLKVCIALQYKKCISGILVEGLFYQGDAEAQSESAQRKPDTDLVVRLHEI